MNTETIKTAKDYYAWEKSLGDYSKWTGPQRDMRLTLFKQLPPEERYLVQRGDTESYFTEENRSEREPLEEASPSGRYRLVVTPYQTTKGSWNYSRGEVFRTSDGEKVADVKRNYGSFWYVWIEDHADGHDYLACGEDYQGQTFCQLDTGEVRSFLPDEAFEGFGFCWASARLLSDGKTLLVNGCYWAEPYEFRLYDVSSPMGGWSLLEIQAEEEGGENMIASFDDTRAVLTYEDGLFVWVQGDWVNKTTGETEAEMNSRHSKAYRAYHVAKEKGEASEEEVEGLRVAYNEMASNDPDPEDDPEAFKLVPEERITLQRDEDGLLHVVERWMSEKKAEYQRKAREEEEARKVQRRKWVEEDELHRHLRSKVDLEGLTGFLIPSYNDRHIEGDPNPCYITLRGRALDFDKSYNHTAQLKWGVVSGPIQLEKWVRGTGNLKPYPEFPRTPEGVEAAWEAAQAHLAAEEGLE